MDKRELLDLYEARGDEAAFARARPLYEQAMAETPDARTMRDYGYLLECHGRDVLRKAVVQYERAIALDPSADSPHYQLIGARAALFDHDESIELYTTRLAAAPGQVREYRFLASAFCSAGRYEEARQVVEAGLELASGDRFLIERRGEVRAATGDVDGALADWRTALSLDRDCLSALYSTAFLLEREDRLDEAIEAWHGIYHWSELRGHALDMEWPQQEIERLNKKRRQR